MIGLNPLHESIEGCPEQRDLKFGLLVEDRYIDQAQPAGVIQALRVAGHQVQVMVAQGDGLALPGCEPLIDCDLLIVRGRSWQLLRTLAWIESHGGLTINSYTAISAVHNKAEMTSRLVKAGIAIPQTDFGSPQQLKYRLPRSMFPILLKPVYGDNGNDIQLIGSPEDLRRIHGPLLLAQQYVCNDGFDLKLYGVGEHVFAVRKPCSVASLPHTPSPAQHAVTEVIPVTPEMHRIARRCGELFGLELFGVDMLETDHGLMVIEVNDFPNYTAVPGASELIADYVCGRVRQEVRR